MNTYSFSKIQEFVNCPYKYKLIYIDKFTRDKSKYTSFGLSIEDAIEFVYNNSYLFENTHNYVTKLLNLFWIPKQYKKQYNKEETFSFLGYDSKKEEKEYFDRGVSYIKEYFNKNKPEKQFAFELKFSVPYKNWLLTGRIDHLKKTNNQLILIDNKVSSYIIYNIKESIQLGLYIYALRVLYPKLKLSDVGYYYVPLQKLTTIKIQDFNLGFILNELERIICEIEYATLTENFPSKVNNFCKLCRFKRDPLNGENYDKCTAS